MTKVTPEAKEVARLRKAIAQYLRTAREHYAGAPWTRGDLRAVERLQAAYDKGRDVTALTEEEE
jgi:hypothetical protein